MERTRRLSRLFGGVLCAVVACSAAVGIWVDLRDGAMSLPTVGFESVLALAGVFGGLTLLGLFQSGWGVTVGSVAMCCVVATGLGLLAQGMGPGDVLRHWLMLARFGLAAMIVGMIALDAFGRNAGAWRSAGLGLVMLVIAGAVIAGVVVGQGAVGGSAGPAIGIVIAMVGGLAGVVTLSLGVHGVIEAFESTRGEDDAVGGEA